MLVSVYRNGMTAGTPPGIQTHAREKRGVIKGWSTSAVRRHTKWLYSIDVQGLTGVGMACTLTVKKCPASPQDWTATRRAFEMRIIRSGAIRVHWLTEWQRRKVPHLHCAIYWPEGTDTEWARARIIGNWLQLTHDDGTEVWGQDAKPIDGTEGWLKYLSKHASRGVRHYQRSGVPLSWDGNTGRLWGHCGTWPAELPMRFDLSTPGGHRLRRLIRSWVIADARKSGQPKRIAYARTMLRCSDPKLGSVRGLSQWIPEPTMAALIVFLSGEGYALLQREDVENG